jgi:hypothetical protein
MKYFYSLIHFLPIFFILDCHLKRLPQFYLSLSLSHIATDGLSVCLGIEPRPGLMTRYLLLFENFCFVFGGGGSPI